MYFGGTATAFIVGATSPFSYAWSNNKTTQTIMGLNAANYSVTITDGKISGPQNASGAVGRSGNVRVSIGAAYANGQLDGATGSGKWNGASGGVPCSGRWAASRH